MDLIGGHLKHGRNRRLSAALFLSCLFFLSGCAAGNDYRPPAQPETIMARDCGLDGLVCCAEEPTCSYAQECCVDPNDPARNRCADKCTCGVKDEFCCAGNTCNAGLACHNGSCAECGREGQACCADRGCQDNLACNAEGRCVSCGRPGNPCCGSEKKCADEDKEDNTRTACSNSVCVLCGSDGQPACGGAYCIAGQLLNNSVCYRCGGYNQPCCNEASERGYACDPAGNLKCNLGFCSE